MRNLRERSAAQHSGSANQGHNLISTWLAAGGDTVRAVRRQQAAEAYPFLPALVTDNESYGMLLQPGHPVAEAIDHAAPLADVLATSLSLPRWAVRRLQGVTNRTVTEFPHTVIMALRHLDAASCAPVTEAGWKGLVDSFRYARNLSGTRNRTFGPSSVRRAPLQEDTDWMTASMRDHAKIAASRTDPELADLNQVIEDVGLLLAAPHLAAARRSFKSISINWTLSGIKAPGISHGVLRRVHMAFGCPLAPLGLAVPILQSVAAILVLGEKPAAAVAKETSRWTREQRDRVISGLETDYPCADLRADHRWPAVCDVYTTSTDWTVVPLDSSADLIRDGLEMGHCVGRRTGRCLTGQSRIFSVRSPDGEPVSTVELSLDGGSGRHRVAEHRGIHNLQPPELAREALREWLRHNVIDTRLAFTDRRFVPSGDSWVYEIVSDIAGFGFAWDPGNAEARRAAWNQMAHLLTPEIRTDGPDGLAGHCVRIAGSILAPDGRGRLASLRGKMPSGRRA
jgi:hypothetical protein